MEKIAFLFPGQGSQEVGMGKDLIEEKDSFSLSLFKYGSEILNEDLIDICLNGPIEKLTKAKFLQASLVCVCLGYWNKLIKNGIKPDFISGHSLGEIISLGAAGVVSPEVCLSIAIKRGQLMDEVAEKYKGGMLAVLFVPVNEIKKILEEHKVFPRVVIASYNGINQIVLSGEKEMLENISYAISSQKKGKCIWVNVVGPWHSPFMKDAEKVFEKWVADISFYEPQIPIIFNGTGDIERNPQIIKKLITRQLSQPVYWDKCMDKLKNEEVNTFFEIGPQKILSTLLRVNGLKNYKSYHINTLSCVRRTLEDLKKNFLPSLV